MTEKSTADNSLEASGILVDTEREEAASSSSSSDAGTDTGAAASEKRDVVASEKRMSANPTSRLRHSHVVALALKRMLKGPAPTLDHIIRFLSSGSGHDKFWMLTQYFTKVVVWLFAKRGLKSASERVRTLSNLVSDYRIMIRLTGLVPMAQYVRYAEQFPAQTRLLQWLDRIMNLTLVCYYPLEHVYWLGAHQILPFSEKIVDLSGYWSCRFWAVWVAMQFVRLGEEYRLIQGKRREIYTRDMIDAAQMQVELDAVAAETKSWKTQLLINACYFPLTLHWSIRGSTFPDVAVGVCGTIAAVAQACNVWKATA
ncbi:hypothetical protein IWW38_001229 [Coemansia aciculifera]|uniref:Uncharacterized protein n=1 Tax=Coemansia aciculifera TaxID=417176 RepID=A0ACC1M8J9_9FUNG|nr:hypothetical protein IWW38_001229 [Coemansia aciculifera]